MANIEVTLLLWIAMLMISWRKLKDQLSLAQEIFLEIVPNFEVACFFVKMWYVIIHLQNLLTNISNETVTWEPFTPWYSMARKYIYNFVLSSLLSEIISLSPVLEVYETDYKRWWLNFFFYYKSIHTQGPNLIVAIFRYEK